MRRQAAPPGFTPTHGFQTVLLQQQIGPATIGRRSRPADVLSLQASSSTASAGGRVLFVGSVTPGKAGRRVYLHRLGSDGDWHVVEVARVRPTSTFAFAWVFGKVGVHRFRARIFSDPRNVGAHSDPVSITVAGAAPNSPLAPAS